MREVEALRAYKTHATLLKTIVDGNVEGIHGIGMSSPRATYRLAESKYEYLNLLNFPL
jgi:hypothetical protein